CCAASGRRPDAHVGSKPRIPSCDKLGFASFYAARRIVDATIKQCARSASSWLQQRQRAAIPQPLLLVPSAAAERASMRPLMTAVEGLAFLPARHELCPKSFASKFDWLRPVTGAALWTARRRAV